MSLTISIRFLTGRAHLHPWQTHHSEGRVDWPPSPWRLLRAFVAIAGRGLTSLPYPDSVRVVASSAAGQPKRRRAETEPVADYWQNQRDDLLPLSRLATLLSDLTVTPTIWLPKTSSGHTRQYFPVHESGAVKPSGSAVFDTFAVIQKDQPLLFHWTNLTLPRDEPTDHRLADLRLLLERMTYFGRAESWCRAEVHDIPLSEIPGLRIHGSGRSHWPCPCIEDGGSASGREGRDYLLERRLASLPMEDNNTGESVPDQARRLMPRTRHVARGSRPKSDEAFGTHLQGEASQFLLLRCLLRESGHDLKDGLERPIGTRWVHYAVPREVYALPRPLPRPVPPRREVVDLVRFALNTATVHRPVLPPLTDTLLVADRFRSAVLALCRVPSQSLSGREVGGRPCQDHNHAFYWPTDDDEDGFIDHITVYSPSGFDIPELDALRRLHRLRQRGGRPDLLVTPVFLGSCDTYAVSDGRGKGNGEQGTALFASATPYFCPLHLSHGGKSSRKLRPIVPILLQSLQRQGINEEVVDINEVVFDYDPEQLAATLDMLHFGQITEPIPPRQFFPVIEPPPGYPPLPRLGAGFIQRFAGACLKKPDEPYPFGLSIGLVVGDGARFIRAMSFCRRRREFQVKGHGRMFLIRFNIPRPLRPFAIGNQCHFGLGLFTPVVTQPT